MTTVSPALAEVLRWFPLVPRPGPPHRSFDEHLADIRGFIANAATATDPWTPIAVAYNRAALVASDHDLPDLARRLCWQHHDRYRTLPTWDARHARLALEPLVNLARLHIRDHRPDDAIALLADLSESVAAGRDTTIDGRTVPTSRIPPGTDDHHAVRTWLWSVHLTEGIRALAAAGRWTDALTHAETHNGIGHRLLDGRQVAIITQLARGDHTTAQHLIDRTDLRDPWEHAVASTLTCANNAARGCASTDQAAVQLMINKCLAVDLGESFATFTTRLGFTASALAEHARCLDLARAVRRGLGGDAAQRLAIRLGAQPPPRSIAASLVAAVIGDHVGVSFE